MYTSDIVLRSRIFALVAPIIIKILLLMLVSAHTIRADFQLVASFPRGAQQDNRLNVADTDRDSLYEIIFMSNSIYGYSQAIWFYEQTSYNSFQFQLVDSIAIALDTLWFMPWIIDDADCDGFYDMIGDWGGWIGGVPHYGMRVYESADSFSFPKTEVWSAFEQYGAMFPNSAFDIDQDGFIEFINNDAGLRIYEAIGNNQYDTVITNESISPSSSYAFGDFDLDGLVEFAMGNLNGTYWIYESPGNNQYDSVLQSDLPTHNINDCFAVADADGDGRMEFVIKGYVWDTRFDVFIFEATNNNTYEIIYTFELWPSGPNQCYSDAGDVDGDGAVEIVLAGGSAAYVIKAAENDSFYILNTITGGANIRVADLNRDGDCEIIASGLNHTLIYQYVPPGILEGLGRNVSESMLRVFPNPCGDVLNIVPGYVEGNTRIRVFDITGTEVVAQNVYEDHESITLDVQDLLSGVYLVQWESFNHSEIKKIVVLK